jgi:signal transduction histidine kinase
VFFLASDSRRVRREHERIAWQRLIRVIGHEVNNTLTPIHSLSSTCLALTREDPLASSASVAQGLALIEQRSQLLLNFINDYARLARLPPPQFSRVRVHECVRVAVDLEQRGGVRFTPGPEVIVDADRAQLEQALVNLIRNAVEAMAEDGGTCQVSWGCVGHDVFITVIDDGPGIANVENLFVPFFSTKPNGSGIGLTLSRHIIESHDGELQITNREGVRGCRVRIRLPLMQSEKPALPEQAAAHDRTDSLSREL